MPLDQLIQDMLYIDEEDLLFSRLLAFVHKVSADVVSYRVVSERLRRVKLEESIVYTCFPKSWTEAYKTLNYYDIDPIIQRTMRTREPFRWFEGDYLKDLAPAQLEYLEELKRHGLVDGIAVPIYGPQGTTAYFGIGSTYGNLTLDEVSVLQVQYACNTLHNRYLEIRGELDRNVPDLSNREREILTWIARGKSNSVIADILGISQHTVDTLVRRCFQKLDVSDRISASLKGVAVGLITP